MTQTRRTLDKNKNKTFITIPNIYIIKYKAIIHKTQNTNTYENNKRKPKHISRNYCNMKTSTKTKRNISKSKQNNRQIFIKFRIIT